VLDVSVIELASAITKNSSKAAGDDLAPYSHAARIPLAFEAAVMAEWSNPSDVRQEYLCSATG
jgi:hypothetical protein